MAKNELIKYLIKNPIVESWIDFYRRLFNSSTFKLNKKRKHKQKDGNNSNSFNASLIIITLIVALMLLAVIAILFEVANPFDNTNYQINIEKGSSSEKIALLLLDSNIIKNPDSFNLIVAKFGIDKKLKAGNYILSPNMSLIKIIINIATGKTKPPELFVATFPEGSSIYRMSKILEENGISMAGEFEKLYKKPINSELKIKYVFLNSVKVDSLEGYLFPETYFMNKNISAEVLADQMLSQFNKKVMRFWEKAQYDTELSLNQVIILASIIEKEAAKSEEREIISSVFHNRLKKNMYLAADPTIKYALDRPTKKVYYQDLNIDSPYNTYKRKGLPPGPICSPGLESIKAAVYPAITNYYFFVAAPDGYHIFSATWQEHQQARYKINKLK